MLSASAMRLCTAHPIGSIFVHPIGCVTLTLQSHHTGNAVMDIPSLCGKASSKRKTPETSSSSPSSSKRAPRILRSYQTDDKSRRITFNKRVNTVMLNLHDLQSITKARSYLVVLPQAGDKLSPQFYASDDRLEAILWDALHMLKGRAEAAPLSAALQDTPQLKGPTDVFRKHYKKYRVVESAPTTEESSVEDTAGTPIDLNVPPRITSSSVIGQLKE